MPGIDFYRDLRDDRDRLIELMNVESPDDLTEKEAVDKGIRIVTEIGIDIAESLAEISGRLR